MRTDSLLAQLNPAQREAVTTNSGPLLVLAGAGTGKTRVVTCRIARLIARGTSPERILAVTFTNKAAGEMQQRVRELLKRKASERPEISTFHSLCVRILRRQITKLGYPERFAIFDRGDQESLAARVLREINVPTAQLRPGDLCGHISLWKSRGIREAQAVSAAETDREHLAAIAYRRYQQALRLAGAVDFDDLLLLTEELFRAHAAVRREEAARFDQILVDEYQDTNASQYRILQALAIGHRNLCVVGDDDQSIYGWRGAEVKHILRFTDDWPDAKVVRLEENYRCTREILQLANRLIRFNRQRHQKTLHASRGGGEKPRIRQFRDENEEAEQTVADIAKRLERGDCEPNDFAILFRTNEQPRAFETALRRAQIPYVLIGGMSFFDRREVRDVLAYLRTIVWPTDEPSLLRIINCPPRGIGPQAVQAILAEAVSRGCPVWDVLPTAGRLSGVSPSAAEAIETFVRLIRQYQRRVAAEPLADCARDLLQEVGYQSDLRRRYSRDPDAVDARWRTVEEIVNALAEYADKNRSPSLSGFLDEILLNGRDQESEKDAQLRRNAVVLLTLHSAKGLEFPHVYLVGMEEGFLPHRRSVEVDGDAIDEERRLCYVGVTRAQERLTLSLALTRRRWGKPRPTQASRFLFELIGQADNPRNPARASAPAR